MARRRRGAVRTLGRIANPFKGKRSDSSSLRSAAHPKKSKKSLAELSRADLNSARNLWEGDRFRGEDGFTYVVTARFEDGSTNVRRSDGELATLRPSASVQLISMGSMRSWQGGNV